MRKYEGHEVLIIVFKHTMSFYEKDTSQAFCKSPSVSKKQMRTDKIGKSSTGDKTLFFFNHFGNKTTG